MGRCRFRTFFLLVLAAIGSRVQAGVTFLDLSQEANRGFDESFDPAYSSMADLEQKEGFSSIPSGAQTFRGIPFRIIDPSTNQDRSFLALTGREKPQLPQALSIPANGLKAEYLYFLHTCRWGGTDAQTPVAEYDVVYADGQVQVIPLRVGVETSNFWGADDTSASYLAWWHKYQSADMGLNLFPWKNPRPDEPIQSVLFKSMKKMPVPLLFAITASTEEIPISPQSPKPLKPFQTDTSHWLVFGPQGDGSGTVLDMSPWLDAPAGRHGSLDAQKGEGLFADGTPARFWGVRLALDWKGLDESNQKKMAGHLAVSGFNLVVVPANAMNDPALGSFEQKLKAQGIYLWLEPQQDEDANSGSTTPTPEPSWVSDPAVIQGDFFREGKGPSDVTDSSSTTICFSDLPTVLEPEESDIEKRSTQRVFGKPFLASWRGDWPNEYIAGTPILFASYADLQDWAGLIQEDAEPGIRDPVLERGELQPLLETQCPLAELAYLRGDLKTGKIYVLKSDTGNEDEALRSLAHQTGLPDPEGNFRTDIGGELRAKVNSKLKEMVSDTGQIAWQGNVGVVKVESPRFQALIGFLGHQKWNNPYWAVETPNLFASLAMVSLTAQPIQVSSHLLLSAVTRMENTGMSYNQQKNLVLSAGQAPVLYEPFQAQVVLYRPGKDSALRVRALGADGMSLPEKVPMRWVGPDLVLSWVPKAFYLEIYRP